jgi:hypothetical protein
MKMIKGALLALLMVGVLGANAASADTVADENHCVDDSHWMTDPCDEIPLSPGMGSNPPEGDTKGGISSDPREKN